MVAEDRARARKPAFVASRQGDGLVLVGPHRVEARLRNGGESGARMSMARLQHPNGALPGAVAPVYGSGPCVAVMASADRVRLRAIADTRPPRAGAAGAKQRAAYRAALVCGRCRL